MFRFSLICLLVQAAFGQDAERTFHVTHAADVARLQQMVDATRVLGQIRTVTPNATAGTVSVTGTSDQLAMSEWLLARLDAAAPVPGSQQFAIGGNQADLLMVYGLSHTATNTGISEILTTLRTVGEIQLVLNESALATIAIRARPEQMALAIFLLKQLDQPVQARADMTVHEYAVAPGGGDTVAVYGLAHTTNPRDLQVLITNLRTVLQVQKVFNVTAPKLLAVRWATRRQPPLPEAGLPVIEWLVRELDRETANPSDNQRSIVDGKDDVVRVFYLKNLKDDAGIANLLGQVRSATKTANAYQSFAPPALILRGTADALAAAGRMVEAADQ